MTRSLLPLALLAGTLALPGLAGLAPAVLAGQVTPQVTTLLNHPAVAASDGTVLAMRQMPAQGQPSAGMGGAASALSGAIGGGAGGGTGGGNWSSMLTAGLGAALSGTGGNKASSSAGGPAPQRQAVEFTLRMDDGSKLTVVQGDDQGLRAGDRVHVIRGEKTRVVRAG